MNMHFHNHASSARPSRLLVNCNRCGQPNVPYDPSNILGNSLCPQCEWQISEQAPPQITSAFTQAGRLETVNPSTDAIRTPPATFKRVPSTLVGDEPPNKRTPTNGNTSESMHLLRRSAMGPAARSTQLSVTLGEEDSDEEFVDAQEDLAHDGDTSARVLADGGGYEMNEKGFTAEETVQYGDSIEEVEEDEADDDDDDLFTNTFRGKGTRCVTDEDEDASGESIKYESDDDDSPKKEKEKTKNDPRTNSPASNSDHVESEHAKGCPPSRGPSTPSGSQTTVSKPPRAPCPPNSEKDLSPNLRALRTFHGRAIQQIPRLPLASHRYWIGVLNLGVNPKDIKNEKQFTWMKGNRMTTVETVWHTYSTTTAQEDFVLMLGRESVGLKDRVEELDYFNNRKVIFRAVEKECGEAKGRPLCEGLIRWPDVEDRGQGVKEVITIDD